VADHGPFQNAAVLLIDDFDLEEMNNLRPSLGVDAADVVIPKDTRANLLSNYGAMYCDAEGNFIYVVRIVIEPCEAFPDGAAPDVPLDRLKLVSCS